MLSIIRRWGRLLLGQLLLGVSLLLTLAAVIWNGETIELFGWSIEVHSALGTWLSELGGVIVGAIVSKPILVAANAGLLVIPLAATLVGFLLWWALAPPRPRVPEAPQSAPPDGLTPAELGVLLGRGSYTLRTAATLVDLAVRGHLSLHEVPSAWRRDYVLRFEQASRTASRAATMANTRAASRWSPAQARRRRVREPQHRRRALEPQHLQPEQRPRQRPAAA
jgi:hypothetical protein